MQFASATVIVAFATSVWVAGQRVNQLGANKQFTYILVLNTAGGDRALIAEGRRLEWPRRTAALGAFYGPSDLWEELDSDHLSHSPNSDAPDAVRGDHQCKLCRKINRAN